MAVRIASVESDVAVRVGGMRPHPPERRLRRCRVHELPGARRLRRVRTVRASRRVVGRELARAVSGWGYRLSARFSRSYR